MLRLLSAISLCVAIAFLGIISIPFGALAQPQCDTRDAVIAVLSEKYKENPVALGVTHNGGLIEILTNGDGSTWSIIVTTPQGMSCLVAAGSDWQEINQASTDPEA
jgi:hypothetical protein